MENLIDLPVKNLSFNSSLSKSFAQPLATQYFESKGYKVYQSNVSGYRSIFAENTKYHSVPSTVYETEKEVLNIISTMPKIVRSLIRKGPGLPDILIYNPETKDVSFVELKKMNDTISEAQILWIKLAIKFNIPIFILIISFDSDNILLTSS
jgi:hypothetical protein